MILIFLARFASLTGVEKSELFTFLRAIVGFLRNIVVRLLFRSDSSGIPQDKPLSMLDEASPIVTTK